MKSKIILFFIILVVIIIIVYLGFFVVDRGSDNGNILDSFKESFGAGNENEGDFGDDDGENGGFGNVGGSAGGGGGSSSSSSSSSSGSSQSGCAEQQISYSASNFIASPICNQYSGQSCMDKDITCSITITNLDDGVDGIFGVAFRFFEEDNEAVILHSPSQEQSLGPGDLYIFEEVFHVAGDDANKEITCFYTTTEIPKKEICV